MNKKYARYGTGLILIIGLALLATTSTDFYSSFLGGDTGCGWQNVEIGPDNQTFTDKASFLNYLNQTHGEIPDNLPQLEEQDRDGDGVLDYKISDCGTVGETQ